MSDKDSNDVGVGANVGEVDANEDKKEVEQQQEEEQKERVIGEDDLSKTTVDETSNDNEGARQDKENSAANDSDGNANEADNKEEEQIEKERDIQEQNETKYNNEDPNKNDVEADTSNINKTDAEQQLGEEKQDQEQQRQEEVEEHKFDVNKYKMNDVDADDIDTIFDTIIVGAGLAGLSAADTLLSPPSSTTTTSGSFRNGMATSSTSFRNGGLDVNSLRKPRVLVLEAQNRAGGRTNSQYGKKEHKNKRFDLGAAWVGKDQKRMLALCERFNIKLHPQYETGKHIYISNKNVWKDYEGLIPPVGLFSLIELQLSVIWKLDKLAKYVPLDDPSKCVYADKWDNISVHDYAVKNLWSKSSRDTINLAIKTLSGTESSQIAFLEFLHLIHSAGGLLKLLDTKDGAQEYKLHGGTQQVSEKLAEVVHQNGGFLSFQTKVTKVEVVGPGPELLVHAIKTESVADDGIKEKEKDAVDSENIQNDETKINDNNEATTRATTATTTTTTSSTEDEENNASQQEESISVDKLDNSTIKNNQGKISTKLVTYRARSIILAAAPIVLIPTIEFVPRLPSIVEQSAKRSILGCYTKAILVYDRPWWRSTGFSGTATSNAATKESPVCLVYDYSDEDASVWALGAFICGDVAVHLADMNDEDKRDTVVRSVSNIFPFTASNHNGINCPPNGLYNYSWLQQHPQHLNSAAHIFLTDFMIKEWAQDEYAKGCPSMIYPCGNYATYGSVFRHGCSVRINTTSSLPDYPLLHFASTDSATSWTGYMEGAVDQGVKVATNVQKMVLNRLRPPYGGSLDNAMWIHPHTSSKKQ